MSFKLDLGKFKKVSSDKNSTTMRHADGHTMKIAHSALSPKMRGQLAELPTHEMPAASFADGGPAKTTDPSGVLDPGGIAAAARSALGISNEWTSSPSPSPIPTTDWVKQKQKQEGYKNGGEIKPHYAGGAAPVDPTADMPIQSDNDDLTAPVQASQAPTPTPTPGPTDEDNFEAKKNDILFHKRQQNYSHLSDEELQNQAEKEATEQGAQETARAGEQAAYTERAQGRREQDLAEQYKNVVAKTKADNILRAQAGAPLKAMPEMPDELRGNPTTPEQAPSLDNTSPTLTGGSAPMGAAQPATGAPSPDIKDVNLQNIYSQGEQGIQQTSTAQQALASGQRSAAISDEARLAAIKNAQNDMNDKMREVMQAAQDHADGHINPKDYMDNMGSAKKVRTAIGLILGGAGSWVTGRNPAMDFLNAQIDRNIVAQQADITNRHNMLNTYTNMYNSSMAGENMTRATEAAIYATQLDKAAATAATPLAKATALKASAMWKQQLLPYVQKASALTMLGQGGASGTPSGQTPAINFQKMNSFQMTGLMDKEDIGTATKEAEKVQDARALQDDYEKSYAELKNKFMAGALTPHARESAIWTLAGKLQHASAGRFNLEDAKKQMDAMFPNKFDAASTGPQIQQNADRLFNSMEAGTPTLDRFGLKNPRRMFDPLEGQTASDAQGNKLVRQQGKWVKVGGR